MSKKKNKAINPDTLKMAGKRKKEAIDPDRLVNGIMTGDRIMLAKAITYVESEHPKHQELANTIIERCLPFANKSIRIGITGSPGVGKSTFIEALGKQVINKGHHLAVLAVDPSSQISKGSILGDKTRMEYLTTQKQAFIRPSPAGITLGGVARKTRETIILCEAAGYDIIFIETVGVGQSEIAVHSMVDLFLLLLLPGAGDDLQGIKRGIVEMADLLIVNKSDEARIKLAKASQKAYTNALHLFPPKENNWIPKVLTCSALEETGIIEIWETILNFQQHTRNNGFFEGKRIEQSKYWLTESINEKLKNWFYNHPEVMERLATLEGDVINGKISPFKAADKLIRQFLKQ